MPTSQKVKKVLFQSLPLNHSGMIYELGSGWGTLAFPLAKKYPQATVIGYEVSWLPFLFSSTRLFFFPQKNLKFKRKDFFKEDLSRSRLIICYLYPRAMRQLELKLEKEALEETLVVSHTFAFYKNDPIKKITLTDLYQTPIYHYLLNKKTDNNY
ncbi:MAG: methyltransferase [Parachlamydiaceae bacterium]